MNINATGLSRFSWCEVSSRPVHLGRMASPIQHRFSESLRFKRELHKCIIDLKHLMDCLKFDLPKSIQGTCYAMSAAPAVKDVQELQVNVYCLENNVRKLCDQIANTVVGFRSKSQTALEELQEAFQLLMHGSEDEALHCLSSASEMAEEMVRR